MMLPIDFRNRPFKPKYIEDETPMLSEWMTFGKHVEDGTTCIVGGNCGSDDIFEGVPLDVAERIVEARRVFVAAIMKELNGHE